MSTRQPLFLPDQSGKNLLVAVLEEESLPLEELGVPIYALFFHWKCFEPAVNKQVKIVNNELQVKYGLSITIYFNTQHSS